MKKIIQILNPIYFEIFYKNICNFIFFLGFSVTNNLVHLIHLTIFFSYMYVVQHAYCIIKLLLNTTEKNKKIAFNWRN